MDDLDINAYLYEHIPLTRALGVRLVSRDAQTVRLSAPLAPNLNHRQTAFGGSIASLGILAGWTLLNFKLREAGLPCRLVIQKSVVDFLVPVSTDFEAVASMPADTDWARFLAGLERRQKARLALEADIVVGEHVVARHEGVYVALLGASSPAVSAGEGG